MADLIVKGGVQDELEDYHISSDFYDALDADVEDLLEAAARRAEANDRQTVMPQDL
ncbi:MAG: DUF1931 family protein [Halobacteriaceae archaeon]